MQLRSVLLVALAFAACPPAPPAPEVVLRAIELTPPSGALVVGGTGTVQLSASGINSDGTRADVTPRVTWQVDDAAVAQVSASGAVSAGTRSGVALVTATVGEVKSAPAVIVVRDATVEATLTGLSLSPAALVLASGGTQTVLALGAYSDGTSRALSTGVTWSTTDAPIATVDGAGLVTAHAVGSTTLTARANGFDASASITVTAETLRSVVITPTTPTLAVGATLQLTATGVFSGGATLDVTQAATWTTTDSSIVGVSAGAVNGIALGTTAISASIGGVSASVPVTVSGGVLTRIDVTPASPTSLPIGVSQQFTATGVYSVGAPRDLTNDPSLVWSSSAAAVASISSAGLATALTQGSSVIVATLGGIASAPVTLTTIAARLEVVEVTPATASTVQGFSAPFHAAGLFSDGATRDLTDDPALTWSTADSNIATISNAPGTRGYARGLLANQGTQVRATMQGQMGSAQLNVLPASSIVAITLSPSTMSLPAGGPPVALRVIATLGNGSTQDVSGDASFFTNNPASIVFNGTRVSALPSAMPSSFNTITATVGAATANASANVTFAAPLVRGVSVILNSTLAPVGYTVRATALASEFDGVVTVARDVTNSVTWTVSDALAARVAPNGIVTPLARTAGLPSPLLIQATFSPAGGSAVTGSAQLRVTDCSFSNFSVAAPVEQFAPGTRHGMFATGTFFLGGGCAGASTGETFNLTDAPQVRWISSNSDVFRFPDAASGTGEVPSTAIPGQQATVYAFLIPPTFGLMSANTTVTVAAQAASSLTVDCDSAAPRNQRDFDFAPGVQLGLPVGLSQQCVAMARFTSGNTLDVTSQATWSSSAPQVASVDGGLVSGLDAGAVMVTAALGPVVGSAPLVINAAAPVSPLTVTAPAQGRPAPLSGQATASAIFRIGAAGPFATYDVTPIATWSSTDSSVATVAAGGKVSNVGAGSTTLRASLLGASGTVAHTVGTGALGGVAVRDLDGGTSGSSAPGLVSTLRAFAQYGATEYDVTSSASWSATPSTVASATQGVVSASATGSADVTAALGASTGHYALNVGPLCATSLGLVLIDPSTGTRAAEPFLRGQRVRFALTATMSDGSKRDVTTSATWSVQGCASGTCLRTPGQGLGGSPSAQALDASRYQNLNHTNETALTVGAGLAGCGATLSATLPVQLSNLAPDLLAFDGAITAADGWTMVPQVRAVLRAPARTVLVTGWEGLSLALDDSLPATVQVPSYATTGDATVSVRAQAVGSTQLRARGVWGANTVSGSTTFTVDGATVNRVLVQVLLTEGTTSTACHDRSAATSWSEGLGTTSDPTINQPAGGFLGEARLMAEMSDGSRRDVTAAATWSTTGPLASVSLFAGRAVFVTGATGGAATLLASVSLGTVFTDSAPVQVNGASLSGIALAGGTGTLVLNVGAAPPRNLDVVGTFGSMTSCITDSTTFTNSTAGVSVSQGLSAGRALGLAPGSSYLVASFGPFSVPLSVVTTTATLFSLRIAPAQVSVSLGSTVQLTGFARFTDGTELDITQSAATFWSARSGVVSITGPGTVRGTSAGSTTVDLTFQGWGSRMTDTPPPGGATPASVTVN